MHRGITITSTRILWVNRVLTPPFTTITAAGSATRKSSAVSRTGTTAMRVTAVSVPMWSLRLRAAGTGTTSPLRTPPRYGYLRAR